MICPANWMPAKTKDAANPRITPNIISLRNKGTIALNPELSGIAFSGSAGVKTSVSIKPNIIRDCVGTDWLLKNGANSINPVTRIRTIAKRRISSIEMGNDVISPLVRLAAYSFV